MIIDEMIDNKILNKLLDDGLLVFNKNKVINELDKVILEIKNNPDYEVIIIG